MNKKIAVREKGLVSILFMSYNHEAVIQDALESLLEQDYPDIEVIMLDDASTDNTTKIVSKYLDRLRDKFVRVETIFNKENCGNIARNENELLSKTRGEYLIGMSGDDVFMRNTVSEMVTMLNDNPECSVAYANMFVIDDDWHYGDHIDMNSTWIRGMEEGVQNHLFERLMYDNCIAAPTVIMKGDVVDTHGYHDESILHEDYEYWIRISRDEKVCYVNKPIMLYRVSQNSMTNYSKDEGNKKLMESLEVDYQVRKKYAQYLSDEQRKICWQHYYAQYLSFCRKKNCKEGLARLNEIMSDLSMEIEERNDDIGKILARKEEENRILYSWLKIKQNGKSISEKLNEKGFKRIAIYGFAGLGTLLCEELTGENIEICYLIDKRGKMCNTNKEVLTLKDNLTPVDCVINTVIGLSEEDIEMIKITTRSELISLKNLFV